jgi:AcrR family transcriptional regulator
VKPKSQLTSGHSARPKSNVGNVAKPRMNSAARRALILEKAVEFFSEYGLTGQTRALAQASGVAQRLLYRYFPSKEELLKEVYSAAILAPFKAVWLAQLEDRSQTIENRLNTFYRDYYCTVLTRRWLRLFLYASLGQEDIAPNYIHGIIRRLLATIAVETAHEQGVELPDEGEAARQIAWILHGSISHLAIRQHIYATYPDLTIDDVIALHVRAYTTSFKATVEHAREIAQRRPVEHTLCRSVVD